MFINNLSFPTSNKTSSCLFSTPPHQVLHGDLNLKTKNARLRWSWPLSLLRVPNVLVCQPARMVLLATTRSLPLVPAFLSAKVRVYPLLKSRGSILPNLRVA